MTTPCETQAPERESYRETIAALERRLDEVRGERDDERRWKDEHIADKHRVLREYDEAMKRARAERDALAERLAAERFIAEGWENTARANEQKGAEWMRRAERYRLRLARVLRFALRQRDVLNDWVPGYHDGGAWSSRALAAPQGDGR